MPLFDFLKVFNTILFYLKLHSNYKQQKKRRDEGDAPRRIIKAIPLLFVLPLVHFIIILYLS